MYKRLCLCVLFSALLVTCMTGCGAYQAYEKAVVDATTPRAAAPRATAPTAQKGQP